MSEHSKTPWKLETVTTSIGVCHKIGPVGSSTKLHEACLYDDCYSNQPRDMTLLADAEFIVRAVNNFDALVEALTEIMEGKGAYSSDPLTHAENCIEDMKLTATMALENARQK